MQQSIPLSQLSYYPPFLSRQSQTPGVLLNDPLENLGALRSLGRFTVEHRSALVAGLRHDMERWNAPASALESLSALGLPDSYAVVTGQQAGIATGPLYTLYKAIGAALAARKLEELHAGKKFVPVFWIEGDDHDFDEARGLTVLNRAGDPAHLKYDDGDSRRLRVGDRGSSQQGIEALITELEEALQPTDFTADTLAAFRKAYADGNLVDGFARMLYAVLGDTPLVIVASGNGAIKRLAADVLARDATDPQPLYDALQATTRQLQAEDMPTPIEPKAGGLFITHEGERLSLDVDGDGYVVWGTEVRYSREEAAGMATERPEQFSPNVVLRPAVQDAALPTAIYIGGPSEVAYLRQVAGVYPVFGMESPAIAPRPFVALLEPKVERVLEATGITLEGIMRSDFDAATQLIDEALNNQLENAQQRAVAGLEQAFAEMADVTARIDQTLEKTLGAAGAKAGKELENLTGRLRSALKKRQETEIKKLTVVREMLLPGGRLQERELNMLYYINKYGMARFREVLGQIALAPGDMQLIQL